MHTAQVTPALLEVCPLPYRGNTMKMSHLHQFDQLAHHPGYQGARPSAGNMFEDKDRVPGDLGFDPLQLMEEGDPNEYKLKELTHCRLAMLGVSGMITQCGLTDSGLYGGHL